MDLPKDPVMLLSIINTYLRDKYNSLYDLCEDLKLDENELVFKFKSINYQYDPNSNQFK